MKNSCLVFASVLCCMLALAFGGCGTEATAAAAVSATTSTTADTTNTTAGTTTTTVAPSTTTTEESSTWTDLKPAGEKPSARAIHRMVYDSGAAMVILFGGGDGVNFAADTWGYDPAANKWMDLAPAGDLPSARGAQCMAYDSATGKVILFAGGEANGTVLDDTWVYDAVANTWTEHDPAGDVPPARVYGSMVYDSRAGKLILFGGGNASDVFNDIWAYDPATDTWAALDPAGDVPPARQSHSMAYDSVSDKVILFGGGSRDAKLNDTWAYDPVTNTWTDLAPTGELPPAREDHAMAYDSASGKVILFGGYDGSTKFNDTWAYDPATNTWTNLAPAGSLPTGRLLVSMVHDSDTGKVILFGGWNGTTSVFDDTWGFAYKP